MFILNERRNQLCVLAFFKTQTCLFRVKTVAKCMAWTMKILMQKRHQHSGALSCFITGGNRIGCSLNGVGGRWLMETEELSDPGS